MIAALVLVACASGPTGTEEPVDSGEPREEGTWDLVAAESWVLDPASDPFPEHRAETHSCDPAGVLVEDGLLEVNTGLCGYAVLVQPISVSMHPGDDVEVLLYHSRLIAETPAEGHVALSVGSTLLWEQAVSIPSASAVHVAVVPVSEEVDLGVPMVLHLHNHGSNSWNLGHLRVTR